MMQAIDQTNPASLDQQGAGVNIARLGDGADAALGAGGMFGIIEEATTMQVWPPAVPSPAWEPNLPALVELTALVVRRVNEQKGYLISVVLPHVCSSTVGGFDLHSIRSQTEPVTSCQRAAGLRGRQARPPSSRH
jgi:hypothetical protein